jgi:multiple sugar transport system permease protein
MGSNTLRIIANVAAWAVCLVWILPFMGLVMAAIRPYSEIVHGWWDFTKFNPSLASFYRALYHPSFPMWQGLVNSLLVALPSTIIPVSLAALAAYGFSRFSFPLKDYLFYLLVVLMAVPQQAMVVPLYFMLLEMGLINTYVGLIIIHSSWGLMWVIFFLRNYLAYVPVEIEEAAKIDGASNIQVFFRIVLPLLAPGLIAAAVLQFTWVWNDFFFALVFLQDPAKSVATQRLPYLRGQYQVDWELLSAASILVMAVPVMVFAVLQRYYMKGMVGWAVKG